RSLSSLRGGGSAGGLGQQGSRHVRLELSGLTCGSCCGGCVSKGEAALMGVPGVQAANINLATNTAVATLSGARGTQEAIIARQADLVAALASLGFSSDVVRLGSNLESGNPASMRSEEDRVAVTPAQRHERKATKSRRRLQTSLLLLAVSAATHLGHHGHHLLQLGGMTHVPPFSASLFPAEWFYWIQAGIATAALVGPGSTLIRSGLSSLRRLSPDMNSLVSTGVLAVYFSSLVALMKPSLGLATTFHEPVMLLGAVLLGRSLEARQRLRAARGLQTLFDVRPDQAGETAT
ncbi:unnamed protein product, partial [Hapterophycus canaliculatus]